MSLELVNTWPRGRSITGTVPFGFKANNSAGLLEVSMVTKSTDIPEIAKASLTFQQNGHSGLLYKIGRVFN